MSFDTEHRPKTFKDVIGNKSTVKSLKSLFTENGLVTHTFLFTGPTGCGKTTFAYIIKNELNCSDFDFVEVNTGNNRGIGTAREILKTIEYAPREGDYKVVLFDEVHQSTKDFQNALLKILEDTPKHVYFILCTTEPRKLLPTIRRRCAFYEVEPLSEKNLGKLLDRVTKEEGQKLLKKVRRKLIDKAEGSPANALMLLEQIIFMESKDQLKAIKVFQTEEQKVIILFFP
jgi:DNA polymerase-3 subunit gamma/tau